MNKLELFRLWDIYGNIFSETQRDICSLYFDCDLTVSEIANEKGITRQAVSDCLKKCKEELFALDAKLNFSSPYKAEAARLKDIRRFAENFAAAHAECDLSELFEILDKDYFAN